VDGDVLGPVTGTTSAEEGSGRDVEPVEVGQVTPQKRKRVVEENVDPADSPFSQVAKSRPPSHIAPPPPDRLLLPSPSNPSRSPHHLPSPPRSLDRTLPPSASGLVGGTKKLSPEEEERKRLTRELAQQASRTYTEGSRAASIENGPTVPGVQDELDVATPFYMVNLAIQPARQL
jgi:hypothetical protein